MEYIPVNLDKLADLAILSNMTITMQFILADPVAKLEEDAKQNLCISWSTSSLMVIVSSLSLSLFSAAALDCCIESAVRMSW